MSTIGPHDPEVETLQQYIDRIVASAPRPDPELMATLVRLLRSGRESRRSVPMQGDPRG